MKRIILTAAAAALLLIPVTAMADGASDSDTVTFSDSTNIFDPTGYSTPWFPSSGPIQVSFDVQLVGDMSADLDAYGVATWPPNMEAGMEGVPNGGTLTSELDVVLTAYIQFDIFGITGTIPVSYGALSNFGFRNATTFDPLLLNDETDLTITAASEQILNETFNVFGLDVHMTVDLSGTMDATFEGESVDLDGGMITGPGMTTAIAYPGPTNSMNVPASFTGTFSGEINLNIIPWVEVCHSLFGCLQLNNLAVPVTLVGNSETRTFPAHTLNFPLPLMAPVDASHDFGTVAVGAGSTWQMVITNNGDLPLDVAAALGGAGSFTIIPELLTVPAGGASSVAVMFSPQAAGSVSGNLTLTTTDPNVPSTVVNLTGAGMANASPPPGGEPPPPPPPPGGEPPTTDPTDPYGDPVDPTDPGGCACTVVAGNGSSSTPTPVLLLVGLLGAALVLRRRSSR